MVFGWKILPRILKPRAFYNNPFYLKALIKIFGGTSSFYKFKGHFFGSGNFLKIFFKEKFGERGIGILK